MLAVTLLLPAGEASGQTTTQSDGSSAVDQYVEDIPTGGGKTVAGQTKPPKRDLPKHVQRQVQSEGGDDAAALEEIATSPAYGAPEETLPKHRSRTHAGKTGGGRQDAAEQARAARADRDARGGTPSGAASGNAFSAAASAVTGGDAARLVGLLVALVVISAVALVGAARRQRRSFL